MVVLSKRESQVLLEILKEGRVSDQEIARRLNTSRPGIAQIRKKLEERGVILGYQPIVDFQKIGLTVQVIIFFSWKDYSKEKELLEFKDFIKKSAAVVAYVEAETAGPKTHAIISIHADLPKTEEFLKQIKVQWKDYVDNVEILLTTFKGVSKPYLFNNPAIEKIENELYSKLILPRKSRTGFVLSAKT